MDLAKTIEDYKNEKNETEVSEPETLETKNEVKEEIKEEEEGKKDVTVELTDFNSWMETHLPGLETHSKIKLQVAGVDDDTVVIKGPKMSSIDDASKKELFLIKECKSIVVPNIPIVNLTIFKNNTIKFLSHLQLENQPDIFMKSYILGSGIINMFCVSIDDTLVPYNHSSIKRSKKDFIVPVEIEGRNNALVDNLQEILQRTPDYEGIELMYKQFGKVKDKLTTKIDIIKWLNKRQDESIDINHHLVIDKVLLSILEIS